jgi:hypothetical protein
MNSVAEDIKDLLVAQGTGTYAGTDDNAWAIFIVEEPPRPNQTITLYNTTSRDQGIKNSAKPYLGSGFQVRVRGVTDASTYAKAREVLEFLDRRAAFSASGAAYNRIVTTEKEPLFLTQDENHRFVYVFNGIAHRRATG